jgi:hypothetical protein
MRLMMDLSESLDVALETCGYYSYSSRSGMQYGFVVLFIQ